MKLGRSPLLLLLTGLLGACTQPPGERDPNLRHTTATRDPTFVEAPDLNIEQRFPSPDGEAVAVVRGGAIQLLRDGQTLEVGTMDMGHIVWRPDSRGFSVQDSQGSGQSGKFSYVHVSRTPEMNDRLSEAGRARFASLNGCAGPDWYANTWADGWTPSGEMRLVIQDGIHSEGCDPAHHTIGVLGDPESGRVTRVLSASELQREWCTAAERAEAGYCYVPS